jgi:hypothetical protein
MLAHVWPPTQPGKGRPFRERRCAAGQGPEVAASSGPRPGWVRRQANSDLSRDRTSQRARWASYCRRRVRWRSRVPGWTGPPSGDRPNSRPSGGPRTWARRPACPTAGPGSRRAGRGRRPNRQRRTDLRPGWDRRSVAQPERCREPDRRRAGRAGWRWRDRSGARAISRSMRRRRGGGLRQRCRVLAESDPVPARLHPVPSPSCGSAPPTRTRPARAPAARPRRSPSWWQHPDRQGQTLRQHPDHPRPNQRRQRHPARPRTPPLDPIPPAPAPRRPPPPQQAAAPPTDPAPRSPTWPGWDRSSPGATAQRSRTGAGESNTRDGEGSRPDRRWGQGRAPGGRRSGSGSGRWPGCAAGSGGR